MSKFTFVKTMETEPPYLGHDESGIPLIATEIAVNTALSALAHGYEYEITHGRDEKMGFWVRIVDVNTNVIMLDVSTFNHGWSSTQHYLFLNAIEAPEKTIWQVAIDGMGY